MSTERFVVTVRSSEIVIARNFFSPLRNVAEHTRAVSRQALLDTPGVAALLATNGGKLTAMLESQGEQQGGHDSGHEGKGEDKHGEGVRHGRRV